MISVDGGERFADFVLFDTASGATRAFHKVLTDGERPARAVVGGWRDMLAMAGASSEQVGHTVDSTTKVTNPIVERRSAKTPPLTTRGLRDVLETGIEQVDDIHDVFAPIPSRWFGTRCGVRSTSGLLVTARPWTHPTKPARGRWSTNGRPSSVIRRRENAVYDRGWSRELPRNCDRSPATDATRRSGE